MDRQTDGRLAGVGADCFCLRTKTKTEMRRRRRRLFEIEFFVVANTGACLGWQQGMNKCEVSVNCKFEINRWNNDESAIKEYHCNSKIKRRRV